MSTHVRVAYGGSDLSNGNDTRPLTVGGLNGTNSDISAVQIATIYTEPGLKTTGQVTVWCAGINYDKWRLSWDNIAWAGWGVQIFTNDVITSTGKALYVQARALPTDNPGRDDTVNLNIIATVLAA